MKIYWQDDAGELAKHWVAWIGEHKEKVTNDPDSHAHVPPALIEMFLELLTLMSVTKDASDKDVSELVDLLDTILQFGMYLEDKKFNYENLKPCKCFTVSDSELHDLR